MRDTANMVKQGIPAVGLVHAPFETLAKTQMKALGIENPSDHLLPYPVDNPGHDSPEFTRNKAREQARRLPGLLTSQRWPKQAEE